MSRYTAFLTKKTKIYAFCYLGGALLQVLLGGLYNWSSRLIFEGLGACDTDLFSQGLALYVAMAIGTGVQIASCSYFLHLFSLRAITDYLNCSFMNESISPENQYGDRVTDDISQFYKLFLEKFSELCVQILKLFYFSALFVSLINEAGLSFSLFQIFTLSLVFFTGSLSVYQPLSSTLESSFLKFEATWVDLRRHLTLMDEKKRAISLLTAKFYYLGKQTYTRQALFEALSALSCLLPYFLPLLLLAPFVFQGALSLGVYMQLSSALTFIAHSLSWLTQNMKELSLLKAAKKRIDPIIPPMSSFPSH